MNKITVLGCGLGLTVFLASEVLGRPHDPAGPWPITSRPLPARSMEVTRQNIANSNVTLSATPPFSMAVRDTQTVHSRVVFQNLLLEQLRNQDPDQPLQALSPPPVSPTFAYTFTDIIAAEQRRQEESAHAKWLMNNLLNAIVNQSTDYPDHPMRPSWHFDLNDTFDDRVSVDAHNNSVGSNTLDTNAYYTAFTASLWRILKQEYAYHGRDTDIRQTIQDITYGCIIIRSHRLRENVFSCLNAIRHTTRTSVDIQAEMRSILENSRESDRLSPLFTENILDISIAGEDVQRASEAVDLMYWRMGGSRHTTSSSNIQDTRYGTLSIDLSRPIIINNLRPNAGRSSQIKLSPSPVTMNAEQIRRHTQLSLRDIPNTLPLNAFLTSVFQSMGGFEDPYYLDSHGIKWFIENGNTLAALVQGTKPENWSTDWITPFMLLDAEESALDSNPTFNTAATDLSSIDIAQETLPRHLFGYALSKVGERDPIIVKVRREGR